MPNIILPEDDKPEEKEMTVDYDSTEEDEERFFLIYHMHVQPSETEAMKPEYRRWLIARFMAQKGLEREAVERHRLMQTIGPSLNLK